MLYVDFRYNFFYNFRIHNFQKEAAAKAGVFHHLITLPTYHTAALSTDMLAKNYFSDMGMLAYVKGVQRNEIRDGVECVKHQVILSISISLHFSVKLIL